MDNGFARVRLCAGDAPGGNIAAAAAQRADALNAVGGDLLELADKRSTPRRARLAGMNAPQKHTDPAGASQAALTRATFGQKMMASGHMAPPPKKPGAKPSPGPLYGRADGEVSAPALTQRDARRARHGPSQGFGLSASRRKPYPQAQTRAKHAKRGLWAAL